MAAGVTVVITTFNDAHFLSEALRSVTAQTSPANEVIVVDDGSDDDPSHALTSFPEATLIRKANGGLSSARNVGLKNATCPFILFLDADDRLTPQALQSGLACHEHAPGAVFVYGGHRRIDRRGRPIGPDKVDGVGENGFADLLTGNRIGMHAAVLYRRDALLAVGGFDERLRRCEDYDAYLRLSRIGTIACHRAIVAEYRWHGGNMSRHADEMLAAVLAVHGRYRPEDAATLQLWEQGRRNFTTYYEAEAEMANDRSWTARGRSTLKAGLRKVRRRLGGGWPPPLGRVRASHLAGDRPVSLDFGWDRGTPIDRYYVERFLEIRSVDIVGRVLEVGDAAYSRRFGGTRITHQDVLHVRADAAEATIVGDLSTPGTLPRATFDCIVLTQTLHLIFQVETALGELAAALKPGGVLLLTVPGISQIDRGEWAETWYWSFTVAAMRRLLLAHFPADAITIEAHGNVFAAVAYLHGLAVEEIDTRRLDPIDPVYPVIVTVRAIRPSVDA